MGITLDTISQAFNSIAIGDGTNLISVDASGNLSTIITDGTDTLAIDASGYITANINGTVTVSASDLDIRSLNVATDGDHVYLMDSTGTNSLAIDANGYITANQGTSPWVIGDGGSSITVDFTRLLDSTDSVAIGDGAGTLLDILSEDAAAAGGEEGFMPLGIRQDASGSPVSADGDYHPMVFDSTGNLKVAGNLTTTPGGYADWQVRQASVTTTASQIDATPLSGRINVIVQNLGSNDVWLKNDNTVTASNGQLLPKGTSIEIPLDDTATADIWAVTASGTATVSVAEYKA